MYATTAATTSTPPALPHAQRAPTWSTITPAANIPMPVATKLTLQIIVNARPRSVSEAPRCTSTMLHTSAPPLPTPPIAAKTDPTQTSGLTAATAKPAPITVSESA